MITVEEVREFLTYNPETGELRWLKSRGSRAPAGAIAGTIGPDGYRVIRVSRIYRAHVLAWVIMTGEWPELQIDHRNGVRHDNRWNNLRLATQQQQNANAALRSDNTSGYRGVHFCKATNKWRAEIRVNGKGKKLGRFKSREEAHEAWRAAAVATFGQEWLRS